jgi:hypothetical protein
MTIKISMRSLRRIIRETAENTRAAEILASNMSGAISEYLDTGELDTGFVAKGIALDVYFPMPSDDQGFMDLVRQVTENIMNDPELEGEIDPSRYQEIYEIVLETLSKSLRGKLD